VVARASGARLVLNERMLAALEERHRRIDRPVPRSAERRALLPQGAIVWESVGAEPAWALEGAEGAFVVLARGGDLGGTLDRHLVPFVQARVAGRGAGFARTLKTAGVSAAELEERLATAPVTGEVEVTIVPADGEVWIRLHARDSSPGVAAGALAAAEASIAGALGEDCYGRDDESLEQVIGRLLREHGLTLSVAESCTGGLLGHRLTNVGGSSAYFERGVIVYSNRAKEELLGVPESILRMHGAVSAPCAEAMARGISERTGSPCGLAITGIAGPDGGTPTKPVGTVFIGLAVRGDVTSRRFRFSGDRAAIKWQSTQMALDMLRRRLQKAPP
jgi:nicotinamide-nucleotide amidase